MGRLRRNQVPAMRRHATGQFVVRLSGSDHYLGHDADIAARKYTELVSRWQARGRTPLLTDGSGTKTTVGSLCRQYAEHARTYYVKNGKETSQVDFVRKVCEDLSLLFGSTTTGEFDTGSLDTLVKKWITDGKVRRMINQRVGCVLRIFRWGELRKLSPTGKWHELKAYPPLRAGRSEAAENIPVEAPPLTDIRAVQAVMRPYMADMIEAQMLTGMRPGEICAMRASDIDRSGDVWVYVVPDSANKTAHLGAKRVVPIGPKAQTVIGKYLLRRKPGQHVFLNQCGKPNKPESYQHAIWLACRRAGLERPWHPHQLRHYAATAIRAGADEDAARTILGHSSVSTTEIYARRDIEKAKEVARKMG